MKKIIKSIRSFVPINIFIRTIVKSLFYLNEKLMRFFHKHWAISGIFKVELPDGEKFKIYSKGDDFIPTQVYWKGYSGYEYSIIPFYYLSKESNTIIDIGANIGYYSIVASASNINSKIYAFEPVERIVNRFEKQIEINNYKNIKIEKLIVGNKNEAVKFFIPKGNSMSLAASTKKGWVSNVDEVLVDSVTLDEYKNQNKINKIDLIKMDCEFHELEVLQGMTNILISDKPNIIMEVLFNEDEGVKGYFENSQHIEIEELMKKNGYYFYLITKETLFRIDKLEYNEIYRNYLFSAIKTKNRYIPYSKI